MKIKKICIGNNKEAFIEERFVGDKINIIHSNENNKGKTIVIQSILYCLGRDPQFPNGYDYKNYNYILELEIKGKDLIILRKENTFRIKYNEDIKRINSVGNFERYFSENILEIPKIIDKNKNIINASLTLFSELFFIGQDNKNTSNIPNNGRFNKDDFKNMIFYFKHPLDYKLYEKKREYEKEKRKINGKISSNYKKLDIYKKRNDGGKFVYYKYEEFEMESTLKELENLQETVISSMRKRNNFIKEINQKKLLEKNLSLLKRKVTNLVCPVCKECGSDNIGYKDILLEKEFFDKKDMKNLEKSLNKEVEEIKKEISKCDVEIKEKIELIENKLDIDETSIEDLLVAKLNLIKDNNLVEENEKLSIQKKELQKKINEIENKTEQNKKSKKKFIDRIILLMNDFNKSIDTQNSDEYTDIFTKKGEDFSGSQATVFYLAKLYAMAKVLGHPFPIIMDSFRAEDLSTTTEKKVLDKYKELNNQVIFTTTTKMEEGNKYANCNFSFINSIDYSDYKSKKLLSAEYLDKYEKELNKLI